MNPQELDELEKEFATMSDEEMQETVEVDEAPKKQKRVNVNTEGNVITFEIIENGGEVSLDLGELSQDIIDRLTMHGAVQKLRDSAAGKSGAEAEEAITRVRDGLMNGEWKVAGEPGSRVSKKQILDGLDSMPEEEQAKARKVLEDLGITL